MKLTFLDRVLEFVVCTRGKTIPIVTYTSTGKALQTTILTYMVFVKDEINASRVCLSSFIFLTPIMLNKFKDWLLDALPRELPLERPEDQKIKLIPRSEPPNQPPYRVSAT